MKKKGKRTLESAERTLGDIREATGRHFLAEENIRIVLDGLSDEDSIAENHANVSIL
jgi:transposase